MSCSEKVTFLNPINEYYNLIRIPNTGKEHQKDKQKPKSWTKAQKSWNNNQGTAPLKSAKNIHYKK
jgi:hypothetical protein